MTNIERPDTLYVKFLNSLKRLRILPRASNPMIRNLRILDHLMVLSMPGSFPHKKRLYDIIIILQCNNDYVILYPKRDNIKVITIRTHNKECQCSIYEYIGLYNLFYQFWFVNRYKIWIGPEVQQISFGISTFLFPMLFNT